MSNVSTESENRNPESNLSLEVSKLEAIGQLYPEEMREPLVWLGLYLQNKCRRSLDVLVEHARKVGCTTDKTNFSKIFRGKWNRDKDGNETTPCVKLKTFLNLVETLRKAERVAELAGKVPFIRTPTSTDIWNYVDLKRAPERVNRFGIIIGHTGTQKTATLKEYSRENNHGLVTWNESPENGSVKEFVAGAAEKYGTNRSQPYPVQRCRLFENFNDKRTLIVENIQRTWKDSHTEVFRCPILDLLQRLQDERNGTVILTLTPWAAERLVEKFIAGYFEQFEGRAGGRDNFLWLPEFATEGDLMAIAEAFKLKDYEDNLDYLQKISRERGRIRRVFEDLQTAKMFAGAKQLTIDHIRMARKED